MNELLLQSEYAEIIIELLREPYNINSIKKIVFMSFCVKNDTHKTYVNRKTDFVDVFFDNINLKLLSHPEELKSILEVLRKLKKSGWIKIEDGKIELLMDFDAIDCNNNFLNWCRGKRNPITEVNKLDDKAFIEEVLRHV